MKRLKHFALLLAIVPCGALGTGCAATVKAQPGGIVDGRQEYSVVCRDNYDLCIAAENKVCPQGHRDLSYSDQVPTVNGPQTWDFEFVCKSPRQ